MAASSTLIVYYSHQGAIFPFTSELVYYHLSELQVAAGTHVSKLRMASTLIPKICSTAVLSPGR